MVALGNFCYNTNVKCTVWFKDCDEKKKVSHCGFVRSLAPLWLSNFLSLFLPFDWGANKKLSTHCSSFSVIGVVIWLSGEKLVAFKHFFFINVKIKESPVWSTYLVQISRPPIVCYSCSATWLLGPWTCCLCLAWSFCSSPPMTFSLTIIVVVITMLI